MAEQVDTVDIPDGMSIPEEIAQRGQRIEGIKKAKGEIEAGVAIRDDFEKKAYAEKISNREEKAKKSGKKPSWKPPKPPTEGPTKRDQVNLTDEESRIMPLSGGGFNQCYNARAGVDVTGRLIVCSHVSQKANDKQEIKPAIEEIKRLGKDLGEITALLGDNGYFSATNCKLLENETITPYLSAEGISTIRHWRGDFQNRRHFPRVQTKQQRCGIG